jgi:hypothetical protein
MDLDTELWDQVTLIGQVHNDLDLMEKAQARYPPEPVGCVALAQTGADRLKLIPPQ